MVAATAGASRARISMRVRVEDAVEDALAVPARAMSALSVWTAATRSALPELVTLNSSAAACAVRWATASAMTRRSSTIQAAAALLTCAASRRPAAVVANLPSAAIVCWTVCTSPAWLAALLGRMMVIASEISMSRVCPVAFWSSS
jgi:hypothetical protein